MRRAVRRRALACAVREIRGGKQAPQPRFVEPCLSTSHDTVPEGAAWIHEIKHDGYRAQAHLNGGEPHIYTRRGYDWSDRFASIAKALRDLPTEAVILDGEVVVTDERGIPTTANCRKH